MMEQYFLKCYCCWCWWCCFCCYFCYWCGSHCSHEAIALLGRAPCIEWTVVVCVRATESDVSWIMIFQATVFFCVPSFVATMREKKGENYTPDNICFGTCHTLVLKRRQNTKDIEKKLNLKYIAKTFSQNIISVYLIRMKACIYMFCSVQQHSLPPPHFCIPLSIF